MKQLTLSVQKLNFLDACGSEHRRALGALLTGELTCLVIENFVTAATARTVIEGLNKQQEFVDHVDVSGLRVLGWSHFQAVRDPLIFDRYSQLGAKLEALLVSICDPVPSPFQSLKTYLGLHSNFSLKQLVLKGEPSPSPFTIRSCGEDIGIEPHQDILSAESPSEEFAASLSKQLAVNIFLASAARGGELEIFDLGPEDTGYENLNEGPKTVSINQLPSTSIRVSPKTGDLILFDCTKVHIVRPNKDSRPRITLACFLATTSYDNALHYWV